MMVVTGVAELESFAPNLELLLIDLSTFDDGALRAKAMTPAATLTVVVLTQCRGVEQPEQVLEPWFDQLELIAQSAIAVSVLTSLGSYLVRATAGPPTGLRVLFDRLGNTGKEAFVTMAEIMGQEWLAKGRQEGRQEGAASMLCRLFELKFGSLSPELEKRILAGSNADLARWSERVFDAKTVAEALR